MVKIKTILPEITTRSTADFYIHMYICTFHHSLGRNICTVCTAQRHWGSRKNMYKIKFEWPQGQTNTQNTQGKMPTPLYLWVAHLHFKNRKDWWVELGPLVFFFPACPFGLLSTWLHKYGGVISTALAYRYTCPMNKMVKTMTRAPATQWWILHLCTWLNITVQS